MPLPPFAVLPPSAVPIFPSVPQDHRDYDHCFLREFFFLTGGRIAFLFSGLTFDAPFFSLSPPPEARGGFWMRQDFDRFRLPSLTVIQRLFISISLYFWQTTGFFIGGGSPFSAGSHSLPFFPPLGVRDGLNVFLFISPVTLRPISGFSLLFPPDARIPLLSALQF